MTFAAMLLDLDLAKVQEAAHHFVLTFLFLGLESEGNVFNDGFHCFYLTKEGADIAKLMMPPML